MPKYYYITALDTRILQHCSIDTWFQKVRNLNLPP